MTIDERFFRHANRGRIEDCWLWRGLLDVHGYGLFYIQKEDGKWKTVRAHRWAYQRIVGPIPSDKVLDHIVCDTRRCCNPLHVAPRTNKENVLRGIGPSAIHARQTHCYRGHAFNKENIRYEDGGRKRRCRQCEKTKTRTAHQAKRAAKRGRTPE